MGCISSKVDSATVDKAVDATSQNKDKVTAGVKSAGAKAGISPTAVDAASQKVESTLTDKEGLKGSINKVLGNEVAIPAAVEGPAAAEAPATTAQ